MLSYLDAVSLEEKNDWIKSTGKDTCISKYAHMNPEFFNSSCLLTAAVLRYRLSSQLWWKQKEYHIQLTKGFIISNPLFQVGFGEDDDYDDHILTVYQGKIYHSFYKKFEWQVVDINMDKYDDEDEINLYEYLFNKFKMYIIYVP